MEFSNFSSAAPVLQSPPEDPDLLEEDVKPDLTRADSYLLSNDWVNAQPEARGRMAEKASALQTEALINAKGGTIEMDVYRDGKKTRDQVAIHGPDGLLSQQARQYLDQSRQAMLRAAEDPDGGVVLNGFTNRLEAASWVSKLASSDPLPAEADPDYARFNEFVSERTAMDSEDKLQGLSFGEFKSWANEGETDPAKQVGDDPELLKKFNRHIKRSTYDPTSMGEDKAVDMVDGELAINPYNLFEIDQVEAEIAAQKMSPSQKRLALMDYHANVSEKIMDGARIFSAADAGPLEAVVNRPLMKDLAAHLEAGGTGIDFLRANKERMSRDSYSAWSETAATFRDALFATGTGATWLAGAALDKLPGVSGVGDALSLPAQLWGEMAEETAQAYRNPVAFGVPFTSIDINRRDLTSLTGQIGSFLALGGLGSAATKAVGLTAAKEALVAGTTKATTSFGTTLAKLTGGKLADKTAGFLVNTATDATAYLGGVQAAGMSFGSTHHAVLQATGDEKEAYRAASIQGISDGLGALIATSVMNRVAPGAERLLGVKPGKLGGSIVQRVRAAKANTAGLAGMMEAKEGLKNLSPELLKQFGKDMRASMLKTASDAGMRGIGIAGDVAAEFGEEAFDEAISDVIGMVIDDSKSWSAGDWGNIHDNFRDYLKAGVLGALGGAMGGSKAAIGSGIKALGSDVERKAEVKRVIEDEWSLMKRNVEESFSNRENLVEGMGGKAVKLAEVLAAPETEISLKEKSAALVSAARGGKLTPSMEAVVPVASKPSEAAPEESKEKSAKTSTPAAEAAPKAKDESAGEVLKAMGQVPAGRRVKKDVKVEELTPSKTTDGEFVPLRIGSVNYAGAKVVTTDASGNKKVTYLNAQQAKEQAPKELKQAFQDTLDQDGDGLTGETNADRWSEKDDSSASTPAPTGNTAVHINDEVKAEYAKLSDDELFSQAKWEKAPDSLDEGNELLLRKKKRALVEIGIRGLQEKFEQSQKNNNDTDQGADDVDPDSEGSSSKPEGARVVDPAASGSDGKDDSDGGSEPGGGKPSVPAAAAEVEVETLNGGAELVSSDNKTRTYEIKGPGLKLLARFSFSKDKNGIWRPTPGIGFEIFDKSLRGQGLGEKVLLDFAKRHGTVASAGNRAETGTSNDALKMWRRITDAVISEDLDPEFGGSEGYVYTPTTAEVAPALTLESIKASEARLSPQKERATTAGRKGILSRISQFYNASPKKDDKERVLAALKKMGAMGHTSGWLNEDAIRDDYRKGLPYLRGEALDSIGSKQKSILFERMGISPAEILAFFEDHGGEEAYIAFIQAHELGHIASGHLGREFKTRGALLDEEHLTSEMEANEWALQAVGFYEWRNEKASTTPVKASMSLPALTTILKIKQGLKWDDKARDATEQLDSNRKNYPGNDQVWMRKSNGQVFFAPGFLQKVLDSGIADPVAFVIESVAALKEGKPLPVLSSALPSLGALATETEVEPMPETRLEPRYVVLKSELQGKTENGEWKRDGDLYSFIPAKGKTLNLAPGEMMELEGKPGERLFLMSVDNGVWVFKRMKLDALASHWKDGDFDTGVQEFQREWAKTRLGASAQRIGPMLDKLLEGKLPAEFEAAFLDILRTVAPNAAAPVSTTIKGGHFLQARAKTLPSIRRFSTLAEVRKELSSLEANPEIKRLEKQIKESRAAWPVKSDESRLAAEEATAKIQTELDALQQSVKELGEQIATGSWKDARAVPAVELTMEVDYPKLVKMLAKKLGPVNLSDPRVRPLVALEASRLLAKWIDEEQIHLITLNEEKFSREEMGQLYFEVAANEEHPFHDILIDTVRERFPGKLATDDLTHENALSELDDIYVASSEFLRKLHQLRIGGATSEIAVAQASKLTQAINADLATGENPTLLKTIGELLRRYTDRLRKVLGMRWAIARLPDTHRRLLDKLNAEYLAAGLLGDVDLVRKKLFTSTQRRMQLSTSDMEESINDIGRSHSEALVALRDLAKEFVHIGVDDYLVFDEEKGLQLHPEMAEFVSKSKDYDLPAIKDALDALNDSNSLQLAWMDAHFAQEAMESALAALDFNPSELLDPTRSFDPSGIMASIVKGSPRGQVETSPLVRQLRDDIGKLDKRIGQNEAYLFGSAFQDVADMDPSKFADRRQLLQRAKMMGVPVTREAFEGDRSFARLKESLEIQMKALRAQSEFRPWEGSYDPKVTPSRMDGVVEGPDLPSSSWKLGSENQTEERKDTFSQSQQALKELKIEKQRKLDELTKLREVLRVYDESQDPTMAFSREMRSTPEVLRIRDQLKQAADSVDQDIANERYRQFKDYLNAADEYNKRVTFMKHRAIGSFDLDSKDYGLSFQDTQHGKEDNRAIPRYGKSSKRMDPSKPAEGPGDTYGYDYVLAFGSVGINPQPGQTFPRNPPKKASLEQKEVWKAIKRTIESNAAFLGREARKDFFLAEWMLDLPGSFDVDGYKSSAGFVLDYSEDEDTGRKTYETAMEAFPGFNGFDLMFEIDRSLDAEEKATSTSKEKNAFEFQSMLNLVKYITKAEDWMKHIRERVGLEDDIETEGRNQTEFISKMGGKQTPAARALLLLEPVLADMENQVDGLKETFEKVMGPYFFYQPNSGKSFLDSFALKEDGSLDLKGEESKAIQSFKEMIPPSTTSAFKIAMEATLGAQSAVSLTRRMLREFNNRTWIDNLEDEAIRTIRDAAYLPDHPEFLQLRGASIDIVTARNQEFNLNYLAKYPGTYYVAGAYAYELAEQFRKVNKGSGVEPFMKMVRARLASGQQVGVVQGSVPIKKSPEQLERERQADLWSDWESMEEGLPREVFPSREATSVAMEGINPEADVLQINDTGPDGQAYNVFSGEQGADNTAFMNEKVGEGNSTQADKAARDFDVLNQARIKRVTSALGLIGFHIKRDDGDVEDSRKFRNDVMRKGLTGEGDALELIRRGMKGLFNAVRNQPSVMEPLVKKFLEENPHWKINAGDYAPNYGQDPTEGAEITTHEKQDGGFDPELFVMELIEFKAQFERAGVEAAKVTDNAQIASALATVLRVAAAGGNPNLEADFKDFAEAHRAHHKQALFGLDKKNFSHVTPEDATAVAKLIRRGMTEGKLGVLDAALLTTEDMWLTSNSLLSMLLTNLPSTRVVNGKRVPIQTLIVTAPADQLGIAQADQVGPRLFPGKDGMPNVVYVPLVDTSRSDAQSMMQQSLLIYGEDKAMRQQISDLAAVMRRTLAPGFNPEASTTLWNNLGQLDSLREQFQDRVLEMDPKDRVKFGRLLVDHVHRSASSLAESAITEGEVKGTGFGSDVLLVSLVMTDPAYKRAFDLAYVGVDRDMDLGLSEHAILALQTALQQANGTGTEHEPVYEDTAADEAPGASNVLPNSKPLIDILDPTRLVPADEFADTAVTPPSDSLLLNMLGGLLALAKTSNGRLQPAYPDGLAFHNREADRLVYEPRTPKDELRRSNDPLTRPFFPDKNKGSWGDIRNRYVGSILNLGNPGGMGVSAMTNAMNQVRVGTQNAALLAQLPSLRNDVNFMVEYLAGKQQKGQLKEILPYQIELTDETLAEIAKTLPPQVALELAAERKLLEDGLTGMDQTLALNAIKIEQAEALLAKQPDGSLMLQRWQKKLKQRDAQLTAKMKTARLGGAIYTAAEQERLQVRALLAKKDLGGLIALSDLEGDAIKEALADQVIELASTLNDRAAGLYEMEAGLVQLSLRKRLELVHKREIKGMRELVAEMRWLVNQRNGLLETDPSGQVREGMEVQLRELASKFNKKLARLNEVVESNLNSHLDRLGLPPRSGVKPLSVTFSDMATITDSELNALARRLSPRGIVSQAKSTDLLLDSLLDWAGREFKAGVAEATGIPVNNKVKKDTAENKRANLEALRRFMFQVEGRSKKEIFNLIDRMVLEAEEGAENRVDQVLKMLVMTTAEGQALIDNETSTEAEQKARLVAESNIIEATRENNRIRRQRARMFDSDGTYYVGRYRHLSKKIGSDKKPLSVQVGVELVAKGMKFDPRKKLAPGDNKARKDVVAEWDSKEEHRRKFYLDRESLIRVLNHHSRERLDEHYKKLRGQADIFNVFDPSKMINEAMNRVRIEDAIIKSRFDEAFSDAKEAGVFSFSEDGKIVTDEEKAAMKGFSKEAVEMLLEHQKGFYTATVESLKGKTPEEISEIRKRERKVRRAKWHLNPKNIKDRRRLVGTLIDDGEPIVLMAVDARERLMRAFPKTITNKNINRQVNDIVLQALGDHKGSGVFMRETMMGKGFSAPFTGDGFTLTEGKGLTTAEASKVFSARFSAKLSEWLDLTRGGKVDLTGDNSTRSIEFFSSLIEQLVQIYQHPGLRNYKGKLNPTGEKVKQLLTSIDRGDFSVNNNGMQNLDLLGTYAEAFAELESVSVMKKLVSGLSIHDDFASLTMMKAFHHQDARVRMRFIKDHIARETAMHLQAFLEKGFDGGRSGREGGHTMREAARKTIADAANKLKRNALDQTIGYVLAQLEGLADNNGMGLSQALGAWMKDFDASYKDLLQLNTAQKARWKGKRGIAERFLWANHVELVRDIPLARKIARIMRTSGAMSQFMAVTYDVKPEQQFNRDENAKEVIETLRKALLASATNEAAVKDYAGVIHKTLRDVYNATAVTLALLSKPQGTDPSGETDEEGKSSSWKNKEVLPSRPTYGSVPLRMAYAANPNSNKPRKVREGKWIPDPADTVAITDSAFFGGAGKKEVNRSNASVFRPLAINGLAAPLSILDDSLYRLNVAPNYEVLRRLTGKVVTQSGIPKVGDSMMMQSASRNAEEEEDYSQEWNIAMAAVATEIESNIFNDGRIGVVNTAFAQTMTFLASTYIVRSLSSVQQLWNQGVSPVTFFVIKKLLTGQFQEASDFLKILSQSVGSISSGGTFHGNLSEFTKRVSPFIHYRGVDGQDVARNELRHQLRYVGSDENKITGKTRQLAGTAAKEYENMGEWALNKTIGSVERVISRAMFASELMSEMRKRGAGESVTKVEDLFDLPADQIPVVANEMARVKVSDMMGQSDQSKKSLMFQSHTDSPVWSSLLRSLVRFSNHTATTSSNMTAFLPGLLVNDEGNRTRKEAAENIIGTIGQNVMFHFAKVHTLVPLLAYAFFLADGDDDDEAARKAQSFADDWLSSEDDGKLVAFGKDLVFGSQKQLFSDKKTANAAQGSALAMLTSKVGMEFAAATPVLGVMAGYSPISSMLARHFINPASEQLASAVTDVEVANAWYEKTRLGVFQYDGGGVENLADITAPTSVLYDAITAPKLAYDAHPTARPIDISLYLASEFIAPLRDYRSARRKEMRDAAKKEEKKSK